LNTIKNSIRANPEQLALREDKKSFTPIAKEKQHRLR
jgi:hypothetical protein